MLLIEHKRSKSKSLRFLFNIIFFPAKIGTLERNLKLCVFSKQIAWQTLVGLTRREDLEKVEALGDVMSPLKCTVRMDSISEAHAQNLADNLYRYKDRIAIPQLRSDKH